MRLSALCLAFVLTSSIASAQEVSLERPTAKNAIYVELGGNGAWYSLNYERYLRKDASVRIGGMYMSVQASAGESSASASWLAVPVFAVEVAIDISLRVRA